MPAILLIVLPIIFSFALVANALSPDIACPNLTKTLKRGSAGNDVKSLQQFLAQDPAVYPEAQASGTYGALTEAAVKRWQAKYNVVSSGDPSSTGFGNVGSRTLAAIKSVCSGANPAAEATPALGGMLTVSPIAGSAPLSVTAQATVNTANVCGGAVYTIDYGDGTPQSQIPVMPTTCREVSKSFAHSYRNSGNFIISLFSGAHRTSATITVR